MLRPLTCRVSMATIYQLITCQHQFIYSLANLAIILQLLYCLTYCYVNSIHINSKALYAQNRYLVHTGCSLQICEANRWNFKGLKGYPIVGNIPNHVREMKLQTGGRDHFLCKLHSKFGPIFKLRMLRNRWTVHVADPNAAEVVFRSEGKFPSRGSYEGNLMWIFKELNIPSPLFFSRGEVWKRIRSNASKQVVPRRVGNFVEPLCQFTEKFLDHVETLKDQSGNVADMSVELYKWAFQGVSFFVYNENIDICSELDPAQQEFMEAGVDYIQSIVPMTTALPIYKLYRNKTFKNYEKILRRMHIAGNKILERRVEALKDAISSGTVDETKTLGLLDQWLIEGKFSEEEALYQSFDMLAAGIDTTSSTASFLLYTLAKHPQIQERLVQEVLSIVGNKEHPSWDDLQKMTLLRNCVKETMRLYFPSQGVSRVLDEDALLLGYQVPAGTSVYINMTFMSKDGQWFEDPNEFNPDRWSKDVSGKLHPFSVLPFGFGPRSCYGRRLAELELYILMAKMLSRYHITTDIKEMEVKRKLFLRPKAPLCIKFQPRN